MLNTLKISKVKPSEPTLNYEDLRSEGLKYIQQLSKKIWTDYNIHDPGITILELLCYAITDLGYRTTYPIQDILTDSKNGAQALHKQFFSAIEILPSKPVTVNDYRKLLIDIEGVKNAWLEKAKIPLKDAPANQTYLQGLYNIILELEKNNKKSESDIFTQVRSKLHQNRNLCEDFLEIRLVQSQPFIIRAELDVAPDTDIDVLQVRIFHEIQKFLTPPVKFYTLQEMFDKGKTADKIFEGPLLEHGFIDDDELEKAHLRETIRLSDIIQLIMAIEGVEVVRDIIIIPSGNDSVPENKWMINVPKEHQPVLNIDGSGITYYKDLVSVRSKLDASKFDKRLMTLQAEETELPQKLIFKLTGQAFSKLRQKEVPEEILASLEPLKNQGYTTKEEFLKKIKRFKITEQSLENLKNEGVPDNILDGLKLLEPEGLKEKEEFLNVVKEQIGDDLTDQYKELILKHTEQTRQYHSLLLKYASEDLLIPEGDYRNIQQYYSFQNHFPRNYGIGEAGLPAATTARKAQAKQLKAYLLFYDQLLANYFAQLAHIKDLFSLDKDIGHTYFIQVVSSVKGDEELYVDFNNRKSKIQNLAEKGDSKLFLQRRNRFLDHLLARFAEKFNEYVWFQYSMYQKTEEDDTQLKKHAIQSKTDFLKEYEKISSERGKAINYTDKANLQDISGLENRVTHLLGIKNSKKRGVSKIEDENSQDTGNFERSFFVVEHILLRPQQATDKLLPLWACSNCENIDPYSFQISVVLPAWSPMFLNVNFRKFVEKTFRLETPAHILPKICWIGEEQMNQFETNYKQWLEMNATNTDNKDGKVLNDLIEILSSLSNVYPEATLAERIDEEVSNNPVILDQTHLGILPYKTP